MTDNATQREKNGLELRFSELCYQLKSGTNSKASNLILKDTCGELRAGCLTAIMGPSGAGKSSLLNVLAGFKLKGVSGHILLNGQPRELQAFRKMSSYIAQNHVMLSLLTVEETLRVSATLKLPSDTSSEAKQKILEDILDVLSLHSCRQTLVRDISGGEHKRLSIGIELITNPPIMFFDEPTSGLDSVASYQVMCYLQKLAHDGRIVVCVVHQPSSRLMQLFDDILVLAHGEVLYSGTQQEMLPSFHAAGFSCPQYYNPGDFVLEVGSESSNQRCESLIEQNKLKFMQTKSTFKLIVDEQTALIHMDSSSSADTELLRPKEQVGFGCQLRVLMQRHLVTMARDFIAVQARVFMHVLIALLLGLVYWQIGNDANKIVSNTSCLFFIILFIFSGNAMPSILLCMQDMPVFLREYYNGWYSLRAYYISKLLADMPLQFICPTLFIGIGYFMTGQPPQLERFVMCWSICILTGIIGHFIGVISGSLFKMQLAIFLVPAISIPFLLFSGFFIRLNELSWFLRPICDISFFRYIFEGLIRCIYGYNRGDMACYADFCYYKSSEKFVKDFGMTGDNFSDDLFALLIFLLLLLIAFYLTLHSCIKRAL
ncbi:ATP-binding cassette sub-family G member 4 isoform X1 [Drosophila busckii]|uniref:ATP-binding cassette sub-family G member 4 isoform X1 n=1 Tax=Drosophila busckii TaxID=30019 RepID=UPI00083EC0CF|nr:ATP-binding cassette sub-family G member 4 isoform X1 [Drosophila busckii]XP_017837723.1 ATP-binding cassette sub-family G member 4 isoform X1 [Drosophila busckii]XP_017837732.1 ATP-binding cassette sub-family G member 4 isoform X1 [Drosophila busckii]XP_017837741.1 ATP-binding cassette sub-family G member 4 isoform X1 [Drosophila busckii]